MGCKATFTTCMSLGRAVGYVQAYSAMGIRFKSWPQGYKTFFMLNSTELEISNAHKFKYIKKFIFSGSDKPRMLFFLLINVKMPTTVGILTMSWKFFISCSTELSMKNFYNLGA